MKKVFLGINIILLWITIWHFYRFTITENLSLSLHNKKIYRRLIFVYSFDEIIKESPAYASNPPNGDGLVVKEYVNKHSGYFYVTSNETKYHLTKEEVMRKFNLKKLSLKNPKFFVDKFGTDRELSNWYKYTYELPQSKLKDEKDVKAAKKIEETIKKRRIFWLLSLVLCLILQILFLVKNKKEMVHND